MRGLPPFNPRSAGTYRLLTIQALAILSLVWALGFTYRGEHINVVLGLLTAVVAVAWLLRWRRSERIADAAEAMALVLAASMAVVCISVLVATLNLPYRDGDLARADGLLFPYVSWPDLVRSVGKNARLMAGMCWVYSTLLWQPFVLVLILAGLGRQDRLWRFVHAWILALIVCAIVFAVVPAQTAYVHYGLVPGDMPFLTVDTGWRPARIIADLRTGAIRELGVAHMTGLITFPSFHAAGAVLLAWGYSRVPVAGIIFGALNVAMLATIPVVGNHYFVDVLGGVAVAVLAIAGSRTTS